MDKAIARKAVMMPQAVPQQDAGRWMDYQGAQQAIQATSVWTPTIATTLAPVTSYNAMTLTGGR